MASNFKPPALFTKVVRQFTDVKKILVSTHPRLIRPGDPLWLNKVSGRYQAEPALLSPTNATSDASTAASASTYTTEALFNAAFAPLFLGFAAGARVPQQLYAPGAFNQPGGGTYVPGDASSPFIEYYSEGIAWMPTLAALASAIEPETLVGLATFANEETTGFYDPSGTLQAADTDYYGYSAASITAPSAANAIGFTVERGNIGDTGLFVQFKNHMAQVQLGGST